MRVLLSKTGRLFLCGSLLWLAGCGGNGDDPDAATFRAALDTFAKASRPNDFLRSAALYQEIIDGGVRSGAVFYNQGNAFMRAGQRGRAIAAYRQAERYLPRDPRLQANLHNALGSDADEAGRRPMIQWVLFWQNWISYPGKFTLAGAAALITFAAAVAGLFRRHRRLLRRTALAGIAITLLLGVSAGYDVMRFRPESHGVVIETEVTARKGPLESYESAFTKPVTEGTEFRLLERRDQWLQIRLSGDEECWIEEPSAVVY